MRKLVKCLEMEKKKSKRQREECGLKHNTLLITCYLFAYLHRSLNKSRVCTTSLNEINAIESDRLPLTSDETSSYQSTVTDCVRLRRQTARK